MRILDTQRRDVQTPSILTEQTGRMLVPASGSYKTEIVLSVTPNPFAYFVYFGRTTQQLRIKYVEFCVHNIASVSSGTYVQTAEIGVFSTPSIPNKSVNSTLTRLGAANLTTTFAVEDLRIMGPKKNQNSLDLAVPAGTYLWAGIRSQITGTTPIQPTLAGLGHDYLEGLILSVQSTTLLTSVSQSTWVGATIAFPAPPSNYYYTPLCPDLRITLD